MQSSMFRGSSSSPRQSRAVASPRQSRAVAAIALTSFASLSLLASGCLDRELKPLNPCLVSGVVDKISVQNVDKVDLLFVVDNSGSMREEQEALRVQFPRLISTLTRGVRADGTSFPAVRDLHLGVVSTDMGLPNVPDRAALGCGDESRPLGDDGILQNRPNPGGAPGVACQPGYQFPFLSFRLSQNQAENDANATQIANDFSCIASLGTAGCGFEMQLEAGLRALWPSNNVLTNGMPGSFAPDNRPFLDGTPFGKEGPAGPNTGFLRNNVAEGLSLVAVVYVSDEEDCSSHTMNHFVPERFLPEGDPLKLVGLNLRCFNEGVRTGGEANRDNGAANLYAVSRYAQGLKALRPGNDNLVIFAAIVGIPTTLADRQANVDFTDPVQRNAYYDSLLQDQALVEVVDPNSVAAMNPNLTPSCLRNIPGSDVPQRAFPPRRFIKVAKEFGENATIQSICSDDFTPAVNQIIDIIARQLGSVCLPRKLARDSTGRVACDVVWELPLPGMAAASTPTACEAAPDLLRRPDPERAQISKEGRPLCVVNQVPVVDCTTGSRPECVNNLMPNQDFAEDENGPRFIHGWYFDDFSNEIANCTGASKQRIAFTNNPGLDAQPPSGVTVRLECLQEAASLVVPRTDVVTIGNAPPPSIGSPCNVDTDCHVRVTGDSCAAGQIYRAGDFNTCTDVQMFCHPKAKACAAQCNNKSECLPGFECDDRPVTRAATSPDGNPASEFARNVCVNPTCGD